MWDVFCVDEHIDFPWIIFIFNVSYYSTLNPSVQCDSAPIKDKKTTAVHCVNYMYFLQPCTDRLLQYFVYNMWYYKIHGDLWICSVDIKIIKIKLSLLYIIVVLHCQIFLCYICPFPVQERVLLYSAVPPLLNMHYVSAALHFKSVD